MCLTKSTIHKKNFSKPFVAEKDIIVYKALDHCDNFGNKCICTPYMLCAIKFIDGKCVMASELEKRISFYVERGIHSYVTEEKIKRTCECFTATKMTKHWAIIPKGSEYFIGENEDVVSNKLIIFKTREDFRKYRRNQK